MTAIKIKRRLVWRDHRSSLWIEQAKAHIDPHIDLWDSCKGCGVSQDEAEMFCIVGNLDDTPTVIHLCRTCLSMLGVVIRKMRI